MVKLEKKNRKISQNSGMESKSVNQLKISEIDNYNLVNKSY